MKHGSQKE
jgi:hypothetical protein